MVPADGGDAVSVGLLAGDPTVTVVVPEGKGVDVAGADRGGGLGSGPGGREDELGITMVLHTWGQNLRQHIHVHCVVIDGAVSLQRHVGLQQSWAD